MVPLRPLGTVEPMRAAYPLLATAAFVALSACGSDDNATGTSDPTVTTGGDSGNQFPGGVAGVEELATRNWLTEDGKLSYAETEPSRGNSRSRCVTTSSARPTRSPTRRASTARSRSRTAAATPSSARTASVSGAATRSTARLRSASSSGARTLRDQIADQTNTVSVELPDGLFGATVYDPEWDGTMLDAAASEQWLSEAAGRINNA